MNNDVARMKLCREQEKEIERLRESLEIAENAYDLLANTHNQQAAEIERLRERCNEWAGRCGTSDGKRLLMQPVIEAARAVFTYSSIWNPDTGRYDGLRPHGSLKDLEEALYNYDREVSDDRS